MANRERATMLHTRARDALAAAKWRGRFPFRIRQRVLDGLQKPPRAETRRTGSMGKVGVGLIAALLCLTACGGDDDDGAAGSGGLAGGGAGGGAGAAGSSMMPGGGMLMGDCAGANVSIGGP